MSYFEAMAARLVARLRTQMISCGRSMKRPVKTVPLYIGLSTGLCSCLTSFSSFIRDAFFAISNDMPTPVGSISEVSLFQTVAQAGTKFANGGYSFMAAAAVLITETGLSLIALFMGTHVALLLAPWTPTISPRILQKFLDPLVAVLAPLSWVATICLVARLPHIFRRRTRCGVQRYGAALGFSLSSSLPWDASCDFLSL